MIKKLTGFVVAALFLMNIYGCFAVVAGAAGGAGTSAWLSGKLSQDVHAPFEKAVKASRSALESMKLEVTKETTKEDVAQIIGKYTDGKTIWIDIHRLTESSSKVEVRVGAVNGDKEASDKILKKIQKYL
jgi:hypothetical protein